MLEADEGEEGPGGEDDGDGAGQAIAIAEVGAFEIVEGVVDAGEFGGEDLDLVLAGLQAIDDAVAGVAVAHDGFEEFFNAFVVLFD